MNGPIIVASNDRFRIVRVTDEDRVTYVTEVPDGCDALGVERWREFKTDNKLVHTLRDYIIRGTLKEQ